MKTSLIYSVLIFVYAAPVFGQTNTESCVELPGKVLDVFIPGYIDTVKANGSKMRAIKTKSLIGGFKLVPEDSLVKVQSFVITFDDYSGKLHQIPSIGDRMVGTQETAVELVKIQEAKSVMVHNIKILYKGVCYRLAEQMYLAR